MKLLLLFLLIATISCQDHGNTDKETVGIFGLGLARAHAAANRARAHAALTRARLRAHRVPHLLAPNPQNDEDVLPPLIPQGQTEIDTFDNNMENNDLNVDQQLEPDVLQSQNFVNNQEAVSEDAILGSLPVYEHKDSLPNFKIIIKNLCNLDNGHQDGNYHRSFRIIPTIWQHENYEGEPQPQLPILPNGFQIPEPSDEDLEFKDESNPQNPIIRLISKPWKQNNPGETYYENYDVSPIVYNIPENTVNNYARVAEDEDVKREKVTFRPDPAQQHLFNWAMNPAHWRSNDQVSEITKALGQTESTVVQQLTSGLEIEEPSFDDRNKENPSSVSDVPDFQRSVAQTMRVLPSSSPPPPPTSDVISEKEPFISFVNFSQRLLEPSLSIPDGSQVGFGDGTSTNTIPLKNILNETTEQPEVTENRVNRDDIYDQMVEKTANHKFATTLTDGDFGSSPRTHLPVDFEKAVAATTLRTTTATTVDSHLDEWFKDAGYIIVHNPRSSNVNNTEETNSANKQINTSQQIPTHVHAASNQRKESTNTSEVMNHSSEEGTSNESPERRDAASQTITVHTNRPLPRALTDKVINDELLSFDQFSTNGEATLEDLKEPTNEEEKVETEREIHPLVQELNLQEVHNAEAAPDFVSTVRHHHPHSHSHTHTFTHEHIHNHGQPYNEVAPTQTIPYHKTHGHNHWSNPKQPQSLYGTPNYGTQSNFGRPHNQFTVNKEHNNFINSVVPQSGNQNFQISQVSGSSGSISQSQSASQDGGYPLVGSPFLFDFPQRRDSENYERTVEKRSIDAMANLDFILKEQHEMLDALKQISENDTDLMLITTWQNNILNELETKLNVTDKVKRSIPLVRLLVDPKVKLDVPKTLENVGTAARNALEDKRAPLYHLRDTVGAARDVVISGLRIMPQGLLIPSKYRIVKADEIVHLQHPSKSQPSPNNIVGAPKERNKSRAPQNQEEEKVSNQGAHDFVGMGEVMNSLGISNPNEKKVGLAKYILHPVTQPTPKVPLLQQKHETKLNDKKKFFILSDIIESDDKIDSVENTLMTLRDLKNTMKANSLKELLGKMKNELEVKKRFQNLEKKIANDQDGIKSQLKDDEKVGQFLVDMFKNKRKNVVSNQHSKPIPIRFVPSVTSATKKTHNADGKNDETVGAGLALSPELLKPFMGHGKELDQFTKKEKNVVVAEINPEVFKKYTNQTLKVDSSGSVNPDKLFKDSDNFVIFGGNLIEEVGAPDKKDDLVGATPENADKTVDENARTSFVGADLLKPFLGHDSRQMRNYLNNYNEGYSSESSEESETLLVEPYERSDAHPDLFNENHL